MSAILVPPALKELWKETVPEFEKHDFNYIEESTNCYTEQDYFPKTDYDGSEAEQIHNWFNRVVLNRGNYEREDNSREKLAAIVDTALARANLTYKEQSLLDAIYKPNIIPCWGVRDLPACEDCLTCKRPESKTRKGCQFHTFIYLNFLTGGAKPRLEYEPWQRYFSVMGSTSFNDEISFEAKTKGAEKTKNNKNSRGVENDIVDYSTGRNEWSVYRYILFEKHLGSDYLWYDEDRCLEYDKKWEFITILPWRARRLFPWLCVKMEVLNGKM